MKQCVLLDPALPSPSVSGSLYFIIFFFLMKGSQYVAQAGLNS